MEKEWVVYILECADGTLYTGMTDHLAHRLAAHASGKGAKYTRGRGPLQLCYQERCENKSQALRREYEIKRYTRQMKLDLIAQARISHVDHEK